MSDWNPMKHGWPICVGATKDSPTVTQVSVTLWDLERMMMARQVKDKGQIPIWMPTRNFVRENGVTMRGDADIDLVTMFVVDSDGGASLDVLKRLGETAEYSVTRIGHTSHSSSAQKVKARVIFPLLEPVPARRWTSFWDAATRWVETFGVKNDPSTKNANRVWFRPAIRMGAADDYDWWLRYGKAPPSGSRTLDSPGCGVAIPLLDPAWIIRNFPPSPRPPAPAKPASRFRAPVQAEDPLSRMKASAERLLAYRVKQLAAMPQGAGQSNHAYATGFRIGAALSMGVNLDESLWVQRVIEAAMSVGLCEKRATGSVLNGIRNGTNKVWEDLIQ